MCVRLVVWHEPSGAYSKVGVFRTWGAAWCRAAALGCPILSLSSRMALSPLSFVPRLLPCVR